jgi:hypothetical protein
MVSMARPRLFAVVLLALVALPAFGQVSAPAGVRGQDEGVDIGSAYTWNFAGSGIACSWAAAVITCTVSGGGGSGDVVGPGSATDNAIARFDSTTGKLIQNSAGFLTDTGGFQAADGSTSAPAFASSSTTNSGMYFSGSDVRFAKAGSVIFGTEDSGGNQYLAALGFDVGFNGDVRLRRDGAAGAMDLRSDDGTGYGRFKLATLVLADNANNNFYTITRADLSSDWNLGLPLITADDTFAVLGLPQTFAQPTTFSQYVDMPEGAAPATPAAGIVRLYAKNSATAEFCSKDDAGTETCMSAGSGGGGGDNVSVNGSAATDADLDDATPAAPSGATNVKWQKDSSTPNNISGYIEPWNLTTTSTIEKVVSASPASSQNDYSPTGWNDTQPARATILRLTPTATIKITGMAGGSAGRKMVISNALDGTTSAGRLIIVSNESASSSAANRFTFPDRMALFLMPGDSREFWYDGTSSRWRPTERANWYSQFDWFSDGYDGVGNATWDDTVNGTGASCQTGSYLTSDTTQKPKGVVQCDSGTTATGRAYWGNAQNTTVPAQGSALYIARIAVEALSTGTDRFQVYAGFQDAMGGTSATDGVYWFYDDATTGDWRICTEDATSQNCTTVTGVTVSTNYIWLGIYVYGDWSDADFFHSTDGVAWTLDGQVSGSNMPEATDTVAIGAGINKTIGTTQRNLSIDLQGVRYDMVRGT